MSAERCSRSRGTPSRICAHSGGVGEAVPGRRSATAPSAPRTAALALEGIGAEVAAFRVLPAVPGCYKLRFTRDRRNFATYRSRTGHVSATCSRPTCRGSTSENSNNRLYPCILPPNMTSRSSLTTLNLQRSVTDYTQGGIFDSMHFLKSKHVLMRHHCSEKCLVVMPYFRGVETHALSLMLSC
eukprot:3175510-Prymnesium_polylepis.1